MVHCARQNGFTTGQNGFTLVELLIAVSLSAVITTLFATTWWQLVTLSNRADSPYLQHLEQVQRLERYLGAAVSLNHHGPAPSPACELITDVNGSILTIWIYPGALDLHDSVKGYCLLTLTATNKSGLLLQLRCPTLSSPASETTPTMTHTFFSDAGMLTIDVLGIDNHWYSQWQKPLRTGLPKAIRINSSRSVIIPVDQGTHWKGPVNL